MGTTKPKSGGLASLLRLEKERLAREAAEQEDFLPPNIPDSRISPSGTAFSVDTVGDTSIDHQNSSSAIQRSQDDKILSESEGGKKLSSAKIVEPEKSEPLLLASTAPPERTETSNTSSPDSATQASRAIKVEIKSLSLTKTVAKKGRLNSRSSKQHRFISNNLLPDIQSFVDRWRPFLTETQLNVCIHIYNNSAALGLEYCFTSTQKLTSVISKTERQIKTVLEQLITLNFLERGETVINVPREKRGTYYKLNLNKS